MIGEESQELKKLRRAMQKVQRRAESAKAELKGLEENLPSFLADHALGEIDDDDLAQIRAEVRRLRETINDAPLAYKALQKRASYAQQEVTVEQTASKEVERYEETKAKLKELADLPYMKIEESKEYKAKERVLIILASRLGRRVEAETLLKNLMPDCYAKRPRQ